MAASGDMKQTELARRSGVAQPNISRYIAGDIPSDDEVKKLCAALPEHFSALAVAYMRDRTPKGFEAKLTISSVEAGVAVREAEPAPWEALPPRLRQLLESAARECEHSPNFVTSLQAIIDLSKEREE